MSLILGCLLAVGLLLIASPWVWPRNAATGSRIGVLDPIREALTQAGLHGVSPVLVVALSLVLGVTAAAAVFALLGVTALAMAAGVAVAVFPSILIRWRASARRRAARIVWPDAVDQLVSAVRAGLALPESIGTLAHSGPTMTREAFTHFENFYLATGNFSAGLDALKDELADPVADRIIETLRMSREVGGTELTTVLRNLGNYLRQERAIRAEVEARQSWVKNAAGLGVAAPWIVLLLLATRPEAAAAYNSSAGAVLVAGGLVVTIVAYQVMVRLGRLPEERRWFS